MDWKSWLDKVGLNSVRFKVGVFSTEWKPQDADRLAAWDLYVELVTRITTQPLADDDGVEAKALESVFALFALTRQTLKTHGRKAPNFSRLAVAVLNQEIRPFTAKWHKRSTEGALKTKTGCVEFPTELKALQLILVCYTRALAELADVEDLTHLDLVT